MIKTISALFVVIAISTVGGSVASADDLTDAMAARTIQKLQDSYGAYPAFLNDTLRRVPFYGASPEFLAKYGSSVGIYLLSNRSVYLNRNVFLADSLDVDSPVNTAVITHEGWHAYFDTILPRAQRTQLENYWVSYYGRGGASRNNAICFGDEAIGNYFQDLTTLYVYAANHYKKNKTISAGMLKMYTASYEAKQVRGYCSGDDEAPYVISEFEKNVAHTAAGGLFPKPEELLTTLQTRLGQ